MKDIHIRKIDKLLWFLNWFEKKKYNDCNILRINFRRLQEIIDIKHVIMTAPPNPMWTKSFPVSNMYAVYPLDSAVSKTQGRQSC
jgi:hypothetical protein